MSRRRRNNTERREATRRVPLRNTSDSRRLNSSSGWGYPTRSPLKLSHEAPSRLKTSFKNTRPYTVTSTPSTNTQTPSKPYRAPNWAPVTADQNNRQKQKKIEQPTICQKRHERRQLMFATGNAGKIGQKKPVWTQQSKITCKGKK